MNYTNVAHPETSDSAMANPVPPKIIDIIREGKQDVSWLNRYCEDPNTKVSYPLPSTQIPVPLSLWDPHLRILVNR